MIGLFHYEDMTMPGKVILQVMGGPLQGNKYCFEEHDTFIFGRSPDCHAQLSQNDKTASRHHFILEANPPDLRIRDLGSLNGTYVNNIKYGGRIANAPKAKTSQHMLPSIDLKDGDTIRVGETLFRVCIEIPLACGECGCEIPVNFKKACHSINGVLICPDCYQDSVTNHQPVQSLHCSDCGRDVATEIGNRRGDYLCHSCQAQRESNPAALMIKILNQAQQQVVADPSYIAGYQLIKKLGEGGMGAVYLARGQHEIYAAIKIMLARVAVDNISRQMFQREIEVTAKLRHPNIVQLFDHGSAGSAFYFVMEYCPGGSLDSLIKSLGGKLPLSQATPIMLQVLEGLAFAHEQGFIHRDLKPANILLTADKGGVAKISDFGLAKSFQQAGLSGFTATGAEGGTPAFMPREQLINFKYLRPVSDIWSIGATFYYLLTGQLPLDFEPWRDRIEVVLQGGVKPIRQRDPNLPKRIAEVIDQAVAENVKDRYQTAKEFYNALVRSL
ncbi:MAG: FHA domain-containing serine/threonine-protein kinase [Acidobacteriota bacterium]